MRPHLTRLRKPALLLIAVVAVAVVLPASAQDPTSPGPPVVDYVFSTHMGTGIYEVDGRRVYILRIPISFRVRPTRVDRWGAKVLLPISAGYHNVDREDLADVILREDVTTLSIVPGIQFERWVTGNWRLRPYAHLGVGKDFHGGTLTVIYDVGIKSRVVIPWRRWEFSVGNELLYAGATATDDRATSLFVRFDTGFDARRGMGFRVSGREPFFTVFVINHFFVNPVEFGRPVREPVTVRDTVELGFALGLEPPARMLGFRIPQVGMSVELGRDIQALKFSMGFRY